MAHTKFNKYAPTTIVLSDLTDDSFTKIENLGIHINHAFSAKLSDAIAKTKTYGFSSANRKVISRLSKKV